MTVLTNVSDEFLDWLDSCPVQWFLDTQDHDSVTYTFMKDAVPEDDEDEDEEEDEEDE